LASLYSSLFILSTALQNISLLHNLHKVYFSKLCKITTIFWFFLLMTRYFPARKELTMLPFQKNDIVTLTISAMSSEGSGIGKLDGVPVFVPLTGVGDVCQVKIVKTAKTYAYGILLQLLSPSPDRVEPDCPQFQKCGGCVYRHISYQAECRIKENRVRDALQRIGGFDSLPVRPIVPGDSRQGYRNKAQIPLGLDRQGKLIMGFYAKHSHRIVDAPVCPLQPAAFQVITDVFRQWFEEYGDSVYNEETHTGVLRHLYLRYGEKTGQIMVCVVINGTRLRHGDKLAAMLRLNVPAVCSLILNTNQEKTNVILGKQCRTVFGSDTIEDMLCGLRFRLSPLSFYQVNRTQAERLYRKAAEYAALTGNEILLDLYCGTGTIGLSMASQAKKLIGAEIIPAAVENARENAKQNGITNAEFLCGDAAHAADILYQR
jgi:23S rRNA (uracil1939-C5)-methyltransferase